MIFKVFFLSLITWILPVEINSVKHLVSYYFNIAPFDVIYLNKVTVALLMAFILFLHKDIYKVLRDFFVGLYLLFYVKRDLATVYERHSGFIELFYFIFLFLLKKYSVFYQLNTYELSFLFIAVALFSLLPMAFKVSNKKRVLNLYFFPLLFFFSFLFNIEGVSVLFLIVIFLRIFSVDKVKANKLAFLSVFSVFLSELVFSNSFIFVFDYTVLLFLVLSLIIFYFVNRLLKRQNIYEISAVYVLVAVWTILDLLFS